MEKPPKFVSLNSSALRLIGKRYYRDGGQWWVGYRFIEGKYDEFLPTFYKGVYLQDCRTFYLEDSKERINAIAID